MHNHDLCLERDGLLEDRIELSGHIHEDRHTHSLHEIRVDWFTSAYAL